MSHVREQLRKAVVTAVTGLTTTGSRVFSSRVDPITPSDCPCLIVTSTGDNVNPESVMSGYMQRRETRIQIDAYVNGVTGFDDELDDICLEVETAIASSSSSLVKGLYYQGVRIEFDRGEQSIGRGSMVFIKDLFTEATAPQTAI